LVGLSAEFAGTSPSAVQSNSLCAKGRPAVATAFSALVFSAIEK
jgi:hypothetical protein